MTPASEYEYRTEHVAAPPAGWRVRTITPGPYSDHQVRIAFPPGRRKKGSGKLVSILHPITENPKHCNPEGLHLSLCVDPQVAGNPRRKYRSDEMEYYRIAMDAAQDAGNRSMKAGGRTAWSTADYDVAAREFDRLFHVSGAVNPFNPKASTYLAAAKRAGERGHYQRTQRLLGKYAAKRLKEREKGNPRRLTVPEQHQLRIASDTLKMPDAMVGVMGGPTKQEARRIILELTGKAAKENPQSTAALQRQIQRLEGKQLQGTMTDKEAAQLRALYVQLMAATGHAPSSTSNPFTESEYYHALSPTEQLAVSSISYHVGHGVPFKKAVAIVKRDYPEWPVAKAARAYQKLKRLGKALLRGNPNNGAARLYSDFHGQDPKEVLLLHERLLRAGDYTALGDDPEIWLRAVKGDPKNWGQAEITFLPEDGVKLAMDADATQLYFVGGNQRLPAEELEGKATDKRFIVLGEAHAISYTTEKSFDGFESIPYAHILGEESGERPVLFYDQDTERLFLAGGAYRIAPLDRELGASPGIVN